MMVALTTGHPTRPSVWSGYGPHSELPVNFEGRNKKALEHHFRPHITGMQRGISCLHLPAVVRPVCRAYRPMDWSQARLRRFEESLASVSLPFHVKDSSSDFYLYPGHRTQTRAACR